MNLYKNSQFSNLKKEYDLSEYMKLKKNDSSMTLFHFNQELNKFLSEGITQGFHYVFYGNTLSGKTYFLENLIIKNIENLLNFQTKILIISTNGSFHYAKIKNICNKKFYNKINEVIDIVRFRTDNEVLRFLLLLNKTENLPYSFIFIDNLNKLVDKKNTNLNTLNTNIENLKKNKNIGVVSVIFKEFNNRFEIKDFKSLVCFDNQNNLIRFDFKFNFFNLDLNLRFINMKRRKYFLKVYKNNDNKVIIYYFSIFSLLMNNRATKCSI